MVQKTKCDSLLTSSFVTGGEKKPQSSFQRNYTVVFLHLIHTTGITTTGTEPKYLYFWQVGWLTSSVEIIQILGPGKMNVPAARCDLPLKISCLRLGDVKKSAQKSAQYWRKQTLPRQERLVGQSLLSLVAQHWHTRARIPSLCHHCIMPHVKQHGKLYSEKGGDGSHAVNLSIEGWREEEGGAVQGPAARKDHLFARRGSLHGQGRGITRNRSAPNPKSLFFKTL